MVVVGECGISPEYFYNSLTYREAYLIMKGNARRARPALEAARMVHGCIGKLFSRDYKLPEFPWDNEHRTKPADYTQEQIDEMRQQAAQFAQQLNAL